ncbi:MAG: aconitase family protein [Gemmatimonadota bacterium]|jgi:homoaconitate hydratase
MGETVVQKIARAHATGRVPASLKDGDLVFLRPRHILTHDNTWAVMGKFQRLGADRVADPSQPVLALDHDIQNRSETNVEKYRAIETFAREQGLAFHPAGEGIGHQLMIEGGFVLPGSLVVASDSHANMYGAVGALGTPVVRTDAAAVWATGEFWWQIPPTVQVVLEGELADDASGKDLILSLCGRYGRGEVLNAAVEFTGPGVASLDMAARLTVANMTTEWGALVGWFPVDGVTLRYLALRQRRLGGDGAGRITDDMLEAWAADPPAPDPDATYAARITVDLSRVRPCFAGPDTVSACRPLPGADEEPIAIDRAYLLSCVNGRLEDLESAAGVLRGRRVAPGVRLYVAAASREIQEAAQASGAWADLLEAGATPLPPGCGACIGLGEGLLEAGEVGISATNRNFRGRMGSRDARVYLASPAVVAASAAAGVVTGPPGREGEAPDVEDYRFERMTPGTNGVGSGEIREDFPLRVRGRLVFLPRDDLNTDGIYGKDHTYRDLSREEMARVVMANYDPEFAGRVRRGDVLVGGRNFGTGSSREQAATALQAAGVALVVAASFSRTYLRNAFNNGLLCIECPALVDRLERTLAERVEAGEATVIPGDQVVVDFLASTVSWRWGTFSFPPLGPVAQELVSRGGIERLVRDRLAGP